MTDPVKTIETAVMVCPQCEGSGCYADGVDEAACSTTCTRCDGNGWIADADKLTIRDTPYDENAVTKPIPLSAARRIAKDYGWDQVVIYGRSVATTGEHMTTYGRTKAMCAAAGLMGKWLQRKMGWFTNPPIDVDALFAGHGVAIRREEDPPIPGEPFMSMADAKEIVRELLMKVG